MVSEGGLGKAVSVFDATMKKCFSPPSKKSKEKNEREVGPSEKKRAGGKGGFSLGANRLGLDNAI